MAEKAHDTELWCEGLPFKRRIRLSEQEAVEFREQILAAAFRSDWNARAWVVLAGSASVIVWAIVDSAIAHSKGASSDHPEMAATLLGISLALPGLLGAIKEIVLSNGRMSRAIFSTSVVALALGAGLSATSLKAAGAVLETVGTVTLFVGGWIALLGRWSDARKWRPVLKQALADLDAGELLEFEREQVEPRHTVGAVSIYRVEILPVSCVAYRVNSVRVHSRRYATVSVAPVPVVFEALQAQVPDLAAPAGLAFSQRHLTRDEVVEVFKRAGTALKSSALLLLFGMAFVGNVMRVVVKLVLGEGHSEAGVWIFAFICAAIVSGRFAGRAWKLRRDGEAGVVVVVRRQGDEADAAPIEESFPRSKIVWSIGGKPAAWRTKKT